MKIDQLQDQRSTGGTELHQAPPGYTVPGEHNLTLQS